MSILAALGNAALLLLVPGAVTWEAILRETALTVHLVIPGTGLDDARLAETQRALGERYGIRHCTIQLEHRDDAHRCAQADPSTV